MKGCSGKVPGDLTSALVSVRKLEIGFPVLRGAVLRRQKGMLRAVNNVSLDIARGEAVGLVGESGCGKSTFARAIIGLVAPTAGSVVFDGTCLGGLDSGALRRMRVRMQMIFQDSFASLSPRMRVADIIAEPLDIHRKLSTEQRRRRIEEVMTLVGLDPGLAERFPHEFSGGQRQRINIARALSIEPDFIVCDEPVSSLDVSIQAQIINLLDRLRQTLGLTLLFISHDLAVVQHLCDRVAVMYLGRLVEVLPSDSLVPHARHPYTRALLSAVAVPDPDKETARISTRKVLVGEPPSPLLPPAGCPFSRRCPLRHDVLRRFGIDCNNVQPKFSRTDHGGDVACHLYNHPAAGSHAMA